MSWSEWKALCAYAKDTVKEMEDFSDRNIELGLNLVRRLRDDADALENHLLTHGPHGGRRL